MLKVVDFLAFDTKLFNKSSFMFFTNESIVNSVE